MIKIDEGDFSVPHAAVAIYYSYSVFLLGLG
jgi:hypothetical protein